MVSKQDTTKQGAMINWIHNNWNKRYNYMFFIILKYLDDAECLVSVLMHFLLLYINLYYSPRISVSTFNLEPLVLIYFQLHICYHENTWVRRALNNVEIGCLDLM